MTRFRCTLRRLAVAALAGTAVWLLAVPASEATAAGTFNLKSGFTAYASCLTANAKTNGAPVILDPSVCGVDQWSQPSINKEMVYLYRDVNTGKLLCIDTAYGRTTAGSQVVVGACTGSPTQQWDFVYVGRGGVDMYALRQEGSGLCLTWQAGAPPQATIQACTYTDSVNQAFVFV